MFYFSEAEQNCGFLTEEIPSGGSTMAVASALVPLVRQDRRTSLALTSPGEDEKNQKKREN